VPPDELSKPVPRQLEDVPWGHGQSGYPLVGDGRTGLHLCQRSEATFWSRLRRCRGETWNPYDSRVKPSAEGQILRVQLQKPFRMYSRSVSSRKGFTPVFHKMRRSNPTLGLQPKGKTTRSRPSFSPGVP